MVKQSGAKWSINWRNTADRHWFMDIDRQKLKIVDSLLEMRRAAQLPIQLPFALESLEACSQNKYPQ